MSSCNNNTATEQVATAETGSDNQALECILTRTSVRQYDENRTISRDTIETLLRAALAAPTAVNKQPWAFVAIDNRQDLDSLATVLPYARMLAKAPLAIVTCGDMSKLSTARPPTKVSGFRMCQPPLKIFSLPPMPSASEQYGPACIPTPTV